MAISKDSFVFCDEGLVRPGSLTNTFNAHIENFSFPCALGFEQTRKTDLYILRTGSGHSVVITLNQCFLSEHDGFQSIQNFLPRQRLTLNNSYGVDYPNKSTDEAFIHRQWINCGKLFTNFACFSLETDIEISYLQILLLNLGIFSEKAYQRRRLAGLKILPECVEIFETVIDQKLDIPKKDPRELYQVPFKSLEFYESDFAYQCDIDGSHSYVANGFYIQDNP